MCFFHSYALRPAEGHRVSHDITFSVDLMPYILNIHMHIYIYISNSLIIYK